MTIRFRRLYKNVFVWIQDKILTTKNCQFSEKSILVTKERARKSIICETCCTSMEKIEDTFHSLQIRNMNHVYRYLNDLKSEIITLEENAIDREIVFNNWIKI